MELPPQPHLGSEHLAEGHRRRLALAPFPPHNPTMPPDLTEDVKAALIELLRETSERDRFPRSPRVKPLRGILAKLGVSSTAAMSAPKPPGKRSTVLTKERRRWAEPR